MKIKLFCILAIAIVAMSCKDDAAKREQAKIKDIKKKEAVFAAVSKSWNFNEPVLNADTQALVTNWSEWRLFLTELRQKPQSSITAFQKKAEILSKRAGDLNNNMPVRFNTPEIKSRIIALITKIRSVDLFVNLDEIPAEKITALIPEINTELAALCRQMEEITQRAKVPLEEGESDMIRMLDTSRAIPSSPKAN